MADVTSPTSQMNGTLTSSDDPYTTTSRHQSLDPRYSDSDGMQYFDFEAFGNDATTQLHELQHLGHDEPDVDTPAEMETFYDSLESPMHDAEYDDEVAADDQSTTPKDHNEPDVSDDEEAAVLRAALANYRNDNPMTSSLIPTPLGDFEFEQQLTHPDEPTHSRQSTDLDTLNGNEKWHVDKESAEFLASVMKLVSDHGLGDMIHRSIRNPLRELKLDEPILSTDPQMELIKLFERNEVHLSSEGIEACTLDTEKDESLTWPAKALKQPKAIHEDIMNAKLEIDAETMEYLRDIHNEPKVDLDDWLKQDREKRLPPRPASPRLVPLSPPYSPGPVDPAAAQLELTSSPDDLAAQEANTISTALMDRDYLAMQKGAEEATKSPLLPRDHSEEPPAKKAKTVCFSDELETLIPELSDDDTIDTHEVADGISALLGPAIEQADESVQQQILNEELVDIDTTLRVPIPAIEDVRPTSPWERYAGEGDGSHRRLIHDAYDTLTRAETKWSLSSKSEQALPWLPFSTHLGRPKAEGDFDDGSLVRYLAEVDLDGDVDLERLTWKPDGLRILDVDEFEDDELDAAHFEIEYDMPVVEAIETVPDTAPALPQAPSQRITAPTAPKEKSPVAQGRSSMDALLQKRKLQLQEDRKAIRNESGLDMFARIQGFANAAADTRTSTWSSNVQNQQPPITTPLAVEATVTKPADAIHEVAIPTPHVDVSTDPLKVIVSFTLMQNHQFVRRLQKLLPNIDLIERDFTSMEPETVKEPHRARFSLEADITISPSTGLMFTNLQKLKQKPLPGQTSSFGIREQIMAVANRYERLIVLVGDRPTMADSQAPLHIMDANDSAALTELINQTAVLETDVEVVYVAGGIDKLIKWTAAVISRNATGDHKLLREETHWERFLRKAGMNAYAAQAVIGAMQPKTSAPNPPSDSSQTVSPANAVTAELARFVSMDSEERIQRIGPMMGGDRLLRRVNRVLDAGWMPSF
ncbi:hypothetical protein PRZ48_014099 [Zasmidium cellare]|uniref:Uncharacterized protein n=1 Tax=Zasmidium cellare TaxID=395010 RepID=A0ABR0E0Q6_ZASCE|nr:hypothetical protein PRZ48_014099 [Zasmidium cellare]